MFKKTLASAAIAAVMAFSATSAKALEEITVAYFLEWPLPFLASKADGTFEKELGVKINWRSFETGTAMSAAMASGDVQMSVSQGVPPFVVAASAGQDIQVIDIAVSYSENDNCVVHADLEIDKDSAKELSGKKVAVPLGTAAHYGFLRQMNHFGIDLASLDVVNMPPPEGAAAALAQKAVDFACGYGGGLTRMKEHGNVLLTGAEKEELGILVFDVTSAPAGVRRREPGPGRQVPEASPRPPMPSGTPARTMRCLPSSPRSPAWIWMAPRGRSRPWRSPPATSSFRRNGWAAMSRPS